MLTPEDLDRFDRAKTNLDTAMRHMAAVLETVDQPDPAARMTNDAYIISVQLDTVRRGLQR